MDRAVLTEKFKVFGVNHRKLNDELFCNDKPPPRLGIYDEDDENLCHEVVKSTCHIPGCKFASDTILEFENHYNASHRYSCSQCKKVMPSPHLLDLHIQETHDSFFAVLAEKKPSYCCIIEECKEKFRNIEDRKEHCIKIHRLPKDFRFDYKAKCSNLNKKKAAKKTENLMETDKEQKFTLSNSRQRGFAKYSGKKFTKDSSNPTQVVNMDEAMNDIRNSLPK